MKRGSLVALVVALTLAVACAGGGSAGKAPASAPDYAGAPRNTDTDDAPPATAKTTVTATASQPPSTPPAPNDGDPTAIPGTAGTNPPNGRPTAPVPPPPSTVGGTVDARRSWALATLGDSENQIQASMKECATACKALASMERAAKTLCDLGAPDECSRAKARVDAAREKVKKSCGSCPNGPSVIPGAPIPSVP